MPPTRRASVAFASQPQFHPPSSRLFRSSRSSSNDTPNPAKSRRLNPSHEAEREDVGSRQGQEEEDEEQEQEEEEEDDSEDIIMAVDHRGRKIGCAFYSAADQRLSLMEDIEFPTSDCLDACEFDV